MVNCATLGLDWRTASLSAYLEGIEAHNEAQSRDGSTASLDDFEPSDRLQRFHDAHKLH